MNFFNKKKTDLVFGKLQEVKVDFNIPKMYETQITMIGLEEDDIKRLHALKPIVEKHSQALVDNFYDKLKNEKSLMDIINKHSSIDKLGKTLFLHIIEIFSGKVDEEYVLQRKRIAHVHQRINLDTKWYINAFQQLMGAVVSVLYTEIEDKCELYQAINSIQKIFSLEQQIVIESYDLKWAEIRQIHIDEKDEIQFRMKETAHELSAIAEETNASVDNLLVQFETIHTLTDNSNQSIQNVANLSEDGKKIMNEEKSSAEIIQKRVEVLHTEVTCLLDLSKKIVGVVDIVSSIANQINLLSLNATIESAHAGEHGKGFAVVANEIRNLSNQTKKSTEDISYLVKEITSQVTGVNDSIKEFSENIEDNRKITEETIVFFNKIVEAVQESKEKTDEVFEEIRNSQIVVQHISEATNEITQTAETLSN